MRTIPTGLFFSFYNAPESFLIESSTFQRNWGAAVDGNGSGRKVTLRNCKFRDNNYPIVALISVSQAEVRIVNCTVTNNFDVTFFLPDFSGLFVAENCTVTQQKGAGVLFLIGTDQTACQVALHNLQIADSNTTAENMAHRLYNIFIRTCTVHISNIAVTNVSLTGVPPSSGSNTFLFFVSQVWMTNITVIGSKADLCLFNAYFSTLFLSDFLVDGFTMSLSLFFIGGANTAHLRNADIRRVSSVSIIFSSYLPYKTLHFAMYNSDITIQNVTVLHTTLQLGPCFAFVFSNYSISSISLVRVSIGSVLMSSESFGLASDLYMDRIVANMHAFVTSNSALTLSNVTLANSQILAKSAFLMGTTEANITNFTVINCSMEAFLIYTESEIVVVNVTI